MMRKSENRFLLKNSSSAAILLILAGMLFFISSKEKGIAVIAGIILSSVFVLSSAWIFDAYQNAKSRLFIKVYFFSTAIRFLLILLVFGILIGATKINEIYFTVSFIISYLCQSVTEIFFINKILQKSSN